MDVLALAREIISGRRLGRQDDLSFFLTCDLDQLCRGADEIRAACVGSGGHSPSQGKAQAGVPEQKFCLAAPATAKAGMLSAHPGLFCFCHAPRRRRRCKGLLRRGSGELNTFPSVS